MSKTLYNRDLQLWIEQTIRQLKNHEFESLDIEHLIEELVDLGKSEKNKGGAVGEVWGTYTGRD